MAFDGIMMAAIAAELNHTILGGKIEKVYQPDKEELLLHIHSRGGKRRLYICCSSNNARVHFIKENVTNPPEPSAFCMLLRKHLQGGHIVEITQKDSERILELSVESPDEMGYKVQKRLIIEIMGKHSNVILVDDATGKIMDSIKRVSIDVSRVRQLLPGKLYEYPPQQDKISFWDVSESDICIEGYQDVSDPGRLLMEKVMGFSPSLAASVASDGLLQAYEKIGSMRRELTDYELHPRVYVDEKGAPKDFHVFPLSALEHTMDKIEFEDVSGAADHFYSHRDSSNRTRQRSAVLKKNMEQKLSKALRKKQRLSDDLLKAQDSEDLRLFGELLTANIHLVRPGSTQITVTSYYDGSEVTIPLDPRYSAAKNAQLYYKKYGKAKTAVREKQIQIEDTQKDIDYLESVLTFIDNASSDDEILAIQNELMEGGYVRRRKNNNPNLKKQKSKPYEYTSCDGFRILAGRNNKENDQLTLKMADSSDIWLHTKDIPGSHVIMFTGGREPSPEAIYEAASIAAWHSKARTSENVPVDYVRVKYVKKPGGAKPGMVIFTHNKTVYVTPKLPEVKTP